MIPANGRIIIKASNTDSTTFTDKDWSWTNSTAATVDNRIRLNTELKSPPAKPKQEKEYWKSQFERRLRC